jgi:hypothetical protein
VVVDAVVVDAVVVDVTWVVGVPGENNATESVDFGGF